MAENIHTGHRERRRENIVANGPSSLAPHELLETLLFYSIPYRDTNPLAHKICDFCGSPAEALHTDTDALKAIGVPENSIRLLHCAGDVVSDAYSPHRNTSCKISDKIAPIVFIKALNGEKSDAVFLLLRNNSDEKIYFAKVGNGTITSPGFRLSEVLRIALLYGAADMMLGFSHKGDRRITPEDTAMFYEIRSAVDHVGLRLNDIFFISEGRCESLLFHNQEGVPLCRVGDILQKPTYSENDAQLLARLLSYALPPDTAIPAAESLLTRFCSLAGILRAGCRDTLSVPSVNIQASVLLRVIGECVARYAMIKPNKNEVITPERAAKLFRGIGISAIRETVHLLLLDRNDRFMDCVKIAEGAVNAASFLPRVLLETAVSAGADGVMLIHTHPFGVPIPSGDDIVVTNRLSNAFTRVDIRFIEHILLSDGEYALIKQYIVDHGL